MLFWKGVAEARYVGNTAALVAMLMPLNEYRVSPRCARWRPMPGMPGWRDVEVWI